MEPYELLQIAPKMGDQVNVSLLCRPRSWRWPVPRQRDVTQTQKSEPLLHSMHLHLAYEKVQCKEVTAVDSQIKPNDGERHRRVLERVCSCRKARLAEEAAARAAADRTEAYKTPAAAEVSRKLDESAAADEAAPVEIRADPSSQAAADEMTPLCRDEISSGIQSHIQSSHRLHSQPHIVLEKAKSAGTCKG